MSQKVLLVGAGLMSQEYAKVLDVLKVDYDTVGRSESTSNEFKRKTGKMAYSGGIERFFESNINNYTHGIITTGIDQLHSATITLITNGIKYILVEKPAGLNSEEVERIAQLAKQKTATVVVGYNRRFYASTRKAKEIIEQDGGVSSFHFEFTEWSHVIEPLDKPDVVKQNWFLANSTHVTDLAFFLGGVPRHLTAYRSGKLSWHKHSKFVGAGLTLNDVPFSYHANWEAPGRWAVEILTSAHRLYFKPMETLQIQKKGSVAVNAVELDDAIDKDYKPGLYKQTKAFLENELIDFCSIEDQVQKMNWYNKISGYDPE